MIPGEKSHPSLRSKRVPSVALGRLGVREISSWSLSGGEGGIMSGIPSSEPIKVGTHMVVSWDYTGKDLRECGDFPYWARGKIHVAKFHKTTEIRQENGHRMGYHGSHGCV